MKFAQYDRIAYGVLCNKAIARMQPSVSEVVMPNTDAEHSVFLLGHVSFSQ
jgi:hypothetical protein